jgi:hypothetical protein
MPRGESCSLSGSKPAPITPFPTITLLSNPSRSPANYQPLSGGKALIGQVVVDALPPSPTEEHERTGEKRQTCTYPWVFWLKGWPGKYCRFVKVEVRFREVRDTQVCSERGLGDSCGVISLVSPRSSALLDLLGCEGVDVLQREKQAGQLWYMNCLYCVPFVTQPTYFCVSVKKHIM